MEFRFRSHRIGEGGIARADLSIGGKSVVRRKSCIDLRIIIYARLGYEAEFPRYAQVTDGPSYARRRMRGEKKRKRRAPKGRIQQRAKEPYPKLNPTRKLRSRDIRERIASYAEPTPRGGNIKGYQNRRDPGNPNPDAPHAVETKRERILLTKIADGVH